jgi:hypothetical protein
MLVSKMNCRMAYHAVCLTVCLLGSSINFHARPEKLRPSKDTNGIYTHLLKQSFPNVFARRPLIGVEKTMDPYILARVNTVSG